VGILKDGVDHKKYAHPLKEHGKKPIQMKKQLYDKGTFNYCVKPTDWNDGKCVVWSNISRDKLAEMAEESKDYFSNKKRKIEEILAEDKEQGSSKEVYSKLCVKVMDHCVTNEVTWNPTYKMKILMTMWKKGHRDFVSDKLF
jgi:hypothetical protein